MELYTNFQLSNSSRSLYIFPIPFIYLEFASFVAVFILNFSISAAFSYLNLFLITILSRSCLKLVNSLWLFSFSPLYSSSVQQYLLLGCPQQNISPVPVYSGHIKSTLNSSFPSQQFGFVSKASLCFKKHIIINTIEAAATAIS